MLSRLLLAVFITTLTSCASANGPTFKASAISKEKALVYVYRKDLGHWQSAYSPTFVFDGKDIASVQREGYFQMDVSPGEHTFGFKHNFMAGYNPVKLQLDISSGQVYYLKISDPISFGGSCNSGAVCGTYVSEIAVIDENKALDELATTKLVTTLNASY